MRDISKEITFRTARSGGKGGQNVNKVESMVEGYWNFAESQLISEEEKKLISQKLKRRINAEGFLLVKSQEDRTQLGNKKRVVHKMNELVNRALVVQKKRRPTKPTPGSKEKRLESKRKISEIKEARKKIK